MWVMGGTQFSRDAVVLLKSEAGKHPDETEVRRAIEQRWGGAVVVQGRPPGERHPRIWRGKFSQPTAGERQGFSAAFAAASVILERFRYVLRTVEPEAANAQAFGHEIRQLLILACTEVETAWKSILVENKYPPPKNGRYTTNDYCKLREALKLEDWQVELTMFGRYGDITPFRGWDPQKPTESLAWYADYNLTKHDREGSLCRATLQNLIQSVAALYIMLAAQAGPEPLARGRFEVVDFRPTQFPQWELPDEYVPAIGLSKNQLTSHLVPYPF